MVCANMLAAMDVRHDALRALRVDLVLAYGSRVRDQARPDSDYDVGVLFAPGIDGHDRIEDVREALGGSDALDIVVLADADPLLSGEAAVDGRVLFESAPGTFEEFRIRAFTMYMDTEWLRTLEADSLRRRYG